MKCRATALMVLLVCSAIAAAAETRSGATVVAPKGETSTLEIGRGAHRARVRLALGDTLRVVLVSGVGENNRWKVVRDGDGVLLAEKELDQPVRPGESRPVRQVFSFAAGKLGAGRLTFVKAQRNAEPTHLGTLALTVTVVPNGPSPPAGIRPQGRLIAKFSGKLPCADCSGIRETMAFYAARSDPGRGVYVDRMKYIGRSFTFIEAGRWLVQRRGTAENPEKIYSVQGNDASSRWRNYRVDGRLLIPLDEKWQPIRSPFNLSLHQIE